MHSYILYHINCYSSSKSPQTLSSNIFSASIDNFPLLYPSSSLHFLATLIESHGFFDSFRGIRVILTAPIQRKGNPYVRYLLHTSFAFHDTQTLCFYTDDASGCCLRAHPDEALSFHFFLQSRRSPSLPTTSPWNLSPASQSTSKRKKAPRH